LDVSRARALDSAAELDRLLRERGADESELIVALSKKASGKQTVTFDELPRGRAVPRLGRHADPGHRRRALRDPLRAAAFRLELVGQEP
jgi:hypothetical protein